MTVPVIIGRATSVTAIYELCEWPSGTPRYVGKTVQYLIDRRKAHLREASNGNQKPVYRWLRKRLASGQGFLTRLIEYVPPGEDWAARERHWIKTYRDQGRPLLNLTDGGEGHAGRRFTSEHRARIGASLRKGAWFNCDRCGERFWRRPRYIRRGHNRFCSRSCSNRRHK